MAFLTPGSLYYGSRYSIGDFVANADLAVTVFADRQGIDQRLFFNNKSTVTTQSETAAIGVQRCSTFKTFVKVQQLPLVVSLCKDEAKKKKTCPVGLSSE